MRSGAIELVTRAILCNSSCQKLRIKPYHRFRCAAPRFALRTLRGKLNGRTGEQVAQRAHTSSHGNGASRQTRGVVVASSTRNFGSERGNIKWYALFGSLGVAGAVLGPAMDGFHSRVGLLIYDKGAITVGTLHTSFWVPLLLSIYYISLGGLHLLIDRYQGAEPVSFPRMALCFGTTTALLEVSSLMYDAEAPSANIALVLAFGAALQWKLFDGRVTSVSLATVAAVAAPLVEVLIMKYLGLWHYPNSSVFGEFGFPYWVPLCYFFYTPAVGNLARWLRTELEER
mmetsp:Transcript_14465/g.27799  ORF Transcript_14465/g.27799 Transcript_14465/m.27799 type:complete len:286 (-) Transcript_14465:95-952(-)